MTKTFYPGNKNAFTTYESLFCILLTELFIFFQFSFIRNYKKSINRNERDYANYIEEKNNFFLNQLKVKGLCIDEE